VARHLLAGGDEVFAVVRPQSRPWRLVDIQAPLHLVECDLTDSNATEVCVAGVRPDLCIHLAWFVEPGRYLDSLENLRWVRAGLNLASALATHGCRRLVGAGTCLEYASTDSRLSEDSPVRPSSLYAASKLGLGLMLQQLGAVTAMQTAWLRFFYLFGPMEDERRLVPSVTRALLENREARVTSGIYVRDFLHVADVASAVCAVARSDLRGPVNIGSGRPVAIRDVVETLGAILGRPDRIAWSALPDDPAAPARVWADPRRLVDGTAWSPRYDLDSGLRDTVEWWRARLFSMQPPHG
jgi:nucleoside-diphosphate-sugar epimerase